MASSRFRSALALTLGLVTAVGGLSLAGAGAASAAPLGTAAAPPAAASPPGSSQVNIVDKNATPETKSLFSYLDTTRGKQVLFGAQNTTANGITFTSTGPTDTHSDVKSATGDYPAIFGFDSLILEGRENPGIPGDSLMQNVVPFVKSIQTAHSLGGIPEISTHMENFETGNDFNDLTGRPVSHILPGGDKNAVYNQYLDAIAKVANTSTDASGKLIPIIFRPFLENTGNFFWWGAGHATTGEFKEIYRYTVEYLRDTDHVHNFLYAFSPNGAFGGDAASYLATYPGDSWVDILGYDNYESSNVSDNSDAYINTVVTDLAMVSTLADARHKIAAFTEFGRNGDRTIQPTGNKSLNFFTDLIAGMEANPEAKRMAYMLTWANFGNGQIYVPNGAYTDANGVKQPANQMLPDFQAYYANPYTAFASNIPAGALTQTGLTATPAVPTVRVVSPADGVRITDPETTIRVKATIDTPSSVSYTVGTDPAVHALTLGSDGYWEGTWNIGAANLTNTNSELNVVSTYADGTTLTATSDVILGAIPTLPNGVVDTFEGYGSNAALQAAYVFSNGPSVNLTLDKSAASQGAYGVRFAYDFSSTDYTGFGKILPTPQDWSGFSELDAHLVPDGSNQKFVLQFNAGGETFEAYPSLAGTTAENLTVPFSQFQDKAGTHPAPTAAQLKDVTQFYIYLNKTDSYVKPGSIGLDDIHAAGTATTPGGGGSGTTQPTVVENFESYANTAALQAAWNGQSSGVSDLTLATNPVGSGTQSGKFSFDFTGATTFLGIGRSLSEDWTGDSQLTLWAQPTSANQTITVQFVAGGVYYEVSPTLKGTTGQQVTISFADAVPSAFQNLDQTLRPTAAQLANISGISVFISKGGNPTSETGAVYLDDIVAQPAAVTPPTATTATVNIELQSHNGSILPGQSASYYLNGQWHPITAADANNPAIVQTQLKPGTYSFADVYNGTREQKKVTISSTAAQTVYFQTELVNVALQSHTSSFLPGQSASFYADGQWRPITTKNVNNSALVQTEMLPGTYSFADVYNGTRQQKVATVATPNANNSAGNAQTVYFQTELVNVQLQSLNSAGHVSGIVSGTASYYADGRWRPITTTNVNNSAIVQAELLPGNYSFAVVYIGHRQQKVATVAVPNPNNDRSNVQTVYFSFAS